MSINLNPDNPLYSVDTVAKMFDVSKYTVRQWIKEGRLPAQKVMGQWKVLHSDVVELANKENG